MIDFPACAVGTWAWGRGMLGSKMIFGQKNDSETLRQTFRTACDLGFTLWDTAEVYGMGESEKILSRCVAEARAEGRDIMISTKHMPKKKYTDGSVREALEGSLSRMGIDCADIYWLHLPNNTEQNMREFAQLMREGKIRAAGVSNHEPEQIKLADRVLREEGFELAAVQNHFSLIRNDAEQQRIIEWCHENNKTYFSYMVLEQGTLGGKYDDEHKFPVMSLRGIEYNGKLKKLRPLIDLLRELGKKYGVAPAQISVAWAVSKGTVPIVGLTKPKYAEELAKQTGCRVILVEHCTPEALGGGFAKLDNGIYRRELSEAELDELEANLDRSYAMIICGAKGEAEDSAYLLCTD